MRTDTERLNWMRDHYCRFEHAVTAGPKVDQVTISWVSYDQWTNRKDRTTTAGPGFRAAIDRAMDESEFVMVNGILDERVDGRRN